MHSNLVKNVEFDTCIYFLPKNVKQIVYSKGSNLQVHVHAEVLNPDTGTRNTTNDFHFTFDTGDPNVSQVMPKTYAGQFLTYTPFIGPLLVHMVKGGTPES